MYRSAHRDAGLRRSAVAATRCGEFSGGHSIWRVSGQSYSVSVASELFDRDMLRWIVRGLNVNHRIPRVSIRMMHWQTQRPTVRELHLRLRQRQYVSRFDGSYYPQR
jgi:hypothetical protein